MADSTPRRNSDQRERQGDRRDKNQRPPVSNPKDPITEPETADRRTETQEDENAEDKTVIENGKPTIHLSREETNNPDNLPEGREKDKERAAERRNS